MLRDLIPNQLMGGSRGWEVWLSPENPKAICVLRNTGPDASPHGLEVIKLEFILTHKIKRNDWQLADTSASSKSLRIILSMRLYSSCITSRPGTPQSYPVSIQ